MRLALLLDFLRLVLLFLVKFEYFLMLKFESLQKKYQIEVVKGQNMTAISQSSTINLGINQTKAPQSQTRLLTKKLVFRPNILIPEPSGCSMFLSKSINQNQERINYKKNCSVIEQQSRDIKTIKTNIFQPIKLQTPIVESISKQKTTDFGLTYQLITRNDCFKRNPYSLFQTPNQHNCFRLLNTRQFLQGKGFNLFFQKNDGIGQNQNQQKLLQVKLQNDSTLYKKTKSSKKQGHAKTRKGKNKQPMAQKFIKKLSGFHYTKNYKQNRNKTIKKIVKRGLSIDLQNFSAIISGLKLSINRKFIRPCMKIKKNQKGKQIDPKKYFNFYHSSFPLEKQRLFIERLYSEVFKAAYITMWKSDERLKRVQNILIEGLQEKNCKQLTSEIKEDYQSVSYGLKIQKDSSKQEQNQHNNYGSKCCNKRKAFVECLDEEGKLQLEIVFQKQYERLYKAFDWGNQLKQKPQKSFFLNRIENFCKIQD